MRLKTRQLKRIAAALGVPAESASTEDSRTIIEGKLPEMSKDPNEVQVVVEDWDDDGGTLFLINDEGVILTIEAVIVSHVTSDEVESAQCAAKRTCLALLKHKIKWTTGDCRRIAFGFRKW